MRQGIFVTATDTEIGKTRVAAGLAAVLADALAEAQPGRAAKLGLWKPVQSGVEPGSPEADSARLIAESGLPLREQDVCALTLPEPLAPWMAARRAGRGIDGAALAEEGRARIRQNAFTLVEGAGGLIVPITPDMTMTDLAAALGLPLLIVARPGLGTVNHTLLSVSYARSRGLEVLGVILNGCRPEQREAIGENRMMIERFGRVPVLAALPWMPEPDGPRTNPGTSEASAGFAEWRAAWKAAVAEQLDAQHLLGL